MGARPGERRRLRGETKIIVGIRFDHAAMSGAPGLDGKNRACPTASTLAHGQAGAAEWPLALSRALRQALGKSGGFFRQGGRSVTAGVQAGQITRRVLRRSVHMDFKMQVRTG